MSVNIQFIPNAKSPHDYCIVDRREAGAMKRNKDNAMGTPGQETRAFGLFTSEAARAAGGAGMMAYFKRMREQARKPR